MLARYGDARRCLAASVAWLALSLTGCSGNGEGLDESGRPIDEGSGSGPPTSDFQTIQDTILTPACTMCHAGASAPRGLRLDAGNSYAMLVSVASAEVPGLLRVNPGDPDASYLVQKIEGRAAVGARMPLGGPPLPQESIDLIRQWITAGAPAPPATATGAVLGKMQPFQVVSTVPADAEEATSVARIMLVFNHPVDAGLAQAGVFELHASGGDGFFGDENDITLNVGAVEVSLTNPTVVFLRPAVPLTPETYQLTLRGGGTTALADVDNRVLDGDGDGIGGDDAHVVFTVVEAK